MKLTVSIRQAFVSSALADVPKVDYPEKARNLLMKAAYDALPLKVRELYDQPNTRPFVSTHYMSLHNNRIRGLQGVLGSVTLPGPQHWDFLTDNDVRKLEEIVQLNQKQNETLTALKTKLLGVANSCTTRKALADLLPEFEKYLPAEPSPADRKLPAIVNVVGDFAAAGWPKARVG